MWQLEGYLGALEVRLTPEQFERLERVSAITLGSPYDMNAAQLATLHGGDSTLMIPPAVPVA